MFFWLSKIWVIKLRLPKGAKVTFLFTQKLYLYCRYALPKKQRCARGGLLNCNK